MNTPRRAFTLIEMLLVVALLGLAGALVIPSMSSVGVLRVQASLRTLVSDITFAQSDAIAFQEKRAIVFDKVNNRYSMLAVPGSLLDEATQTMYDPSKPNGQYIVDFNVGNYGGARITEVSMNGQTSNNVLVFDDLGSPIINVSSDQPSTGGFVTITAPDSQWNVVIDAFTGRVSVRKLAGN